MAEEDVVHQRQYTRLHRIWQAALQRHPHTLGVFAPRFNHFFRVRGAYFRRRSGSVLERYLNSAAGATSPTRQRALLWERAPPPRTVPGPGLVATGKVRAVLAGFAPVRSASNPPPPPHVQVRHTLAETRAVHALRVRTERDAQTAAVQAYGALAPCVVSDDSESDDEEEAEAAEVAAQAASTTQTFEDKDGRRVEFGDVVVCTVTGQRFLWGNHARIDGTGGIAVAPMGSAGFAGPQALSGHPGGVGGGVGGGGSALTHLALCPGSTTRLATVQLDMAL